jgi:hypothetical protein
MTLRAPNMLAQAGVLAAGRPAPNLEPACSRV